MSHFNYTVDTDYDDNLRVIVKVDHGSVPDTWEAAAHDALVNIVGEHEGIPQVSDLETIERILGGMASEANATTFNAAALVQDMVAIARIARPYVQMVNDQIVNLLASKQRDYGTGNILAFGLTGLHVRMSDKVARLRNLYERNSEGTVEPLADAWLDLVGYAVIAHMLHNGVFERPLLEDALPWTRQQFMQMLADVGNAIVREVTS